MNKLDIIINGDVFDGNISELERLLQLSRCKLRMKIARRIHKGLDNFTLSVGDNELIFNKKNNTKKYKVYGI